MATIPAVPSPTVWSNAFPLSSVLPLSHHRRGSFHRGRDPILPILGGADQRFDSVCALKPITYMSRSFECRLHLLVVSLNWSKSSYGCCVEEKKQNMLVRLLNPIVRLISWIDWRYYLASNNKVRTHLFALFTIFFAQILIFGFYCWWKDVFIYLSK